MNVTLAALTMSRTSAAERGRVSALLGGLTSGTQIIAFAAGGALAAVFAPRTLFVAAGALGLLVPLALGPGLIRSTHANTSTPSTPTPTSAPMPPTPPPPPTPTAAATAPAPTAATTAPADAPTVATAG
jgi:MFS family permease